MYHPRTQGMALDYAAGQVEQRVSILSQYVRGQLFAAISELERDVIGLVSVAYHTGAGATGWTYADMRGSGRMFALRERLHRLILDRFAALAQKLGRWIVSGRAWGAVGMLYQIDAVTPPTYRPTAALTADQLRGPAAMIHRVEFGLQHQADNLWRDLTRTLERSMLEGEALQAALARIQDVFGRESRRPRKVIEAMRIREADPATAVAATIGATDQSPITGYVDPATWDAAVADLRDAMGWSTRAPDYETPDGGAAYAVERDMMTEFTRAVRDGSMDAAMPNGEAVTDFVWVTTIDDRMCEDCQMRADLTMTEIAAKFGDDTAPPLHPNCRCAIIPSLPEWNPLAGDWASGTNPTGGRLVTDPTTGDTGYPAVDDFASWLSKWED